MESHGRTRPSTRRRTSPTRRICSRLRAPRGCGGSSTQAASTCSSASAPKAISRSTTTSLLRDFSLWRGQGAWRRALRREHTLPRVVDGLPADPVLSRAGRVPERFKRTGAGVRLHRRPFALTTSCIISNRVDPRPKRKLRTTPLCQQAGRQIVWASRPRVAQIAGSRATNACDEGAPARLRCPCGRSRSVPLEHDDEDVRAPASRLLAELDRAAARRR